MASSDYGFHSFGSDVAVDTSVDGKGTVEFQLKGDGRKRPRSVNERPPSYNEKLGLLGNTSESFFTPSGGINYDVAQSYAIPAAVALGVGMLLFRR